MLSKKKIDKKLRSYIKEHLGKGYSKHAIKKMLVDHGYDENYVDGLIRKHAELDFVKKYAVIVSLLFIFSIFSFNITKINQSPEITGLAISAPSEGCCTSICQQTSRDECYGKFVAGGKCNQLEECNVGCCIDKEGYCLTNYLSGNCVTSYGTNINKDCKDLVFCRNITDKSYASRRYNIKNKAAGFSSSKSTAGYYKSSFSIQYYVYDKANLLSVTAQIKDNGKIIDSISLYDDGSHNDGAKNDNVYGNNWQSSRISDFEGFKKFDVDVVVKHDDSQQSINNIQSITLVKGNKCLPVFTEWDNGKKHSIIFAAQNYDAYGYPKFETDVENFLNVLFSTDKFSQGKNDVNVYRLEQSLSYFNIPTLASIASSSCPSYSSKKDLIVILDPNEQYCILESNKMIRMNPQALFYQNISSKELNESFADFCSYVLTPKKLADNIIEYATPPTITVLTSTNLTHDLGSLNLSFSISAVNYPVNYSVTIANAKILDKATNEKVTDSIVLSLTNGTNQALIRAVDRNRNKAFAPIIINTTLQ
ncbi:hypothetical protein HY487_01145 [Candidatus Woesearchaeota archaeon]|nr:hypothetical protein [Candidatus Woesearchaeota archaeon]